MEFSQILAILLIGAVSGWLAGIIRQGYGFGLWGNMIVGVLGAFVGGWLFERLNFHIGTGLLNQIFTSVIGALVLLFVIGLFKNK